MKVNSNSDIEFNVPYVKLFDFIDQTNTTIIDAINSLPYSHEEQLKISDVISKYTESQILTVVSFVEEK